LYTTVLSLLTAVTVVLGMRMMGALLISSLLIFPALTAMRVCKRFFTVVVFAAVSAVICFFVGMMISFVWDIPSGASVVLTHGVAFLCASAVRLLRRKNG
ncbi:MAG: metal ABC transporter permease, partial [Clostridia bacterium]|nr:metal ABC transporter permease [Clostridia bacterium]